jgi:hypothetical protein
MSTRLFRHPDGTQPAANARGGVLMTWLTGSCYANLRRKHMRHHIDRADVISLDTKALLLKLLARQEHAELWPNHDMAFWKTLRRFPECHE